MVPTTPLTKVAVATNSARPPRMAGSRVTSTVPSPSTVNGAMRLIAAMAVADSPTSDARNNRAANAQ